VASIQVAGDHSGRPGLVRRQGWQGRNRYRAAQLRRAIALLALYLADHATAERVQRLGEEPFWTSASDQRSLAIIDRLIQEN